MILEQHIENAKNAVKWKNDKMVEQDLIISKVLVSMYNNPIIRDTLVFRGGTALNKLFLHPSARYSEDLDFVQLKSQRIGPVSKAIRESMRWLQEEANLGRPVSILKKYGLKYFYKFPNIDGGISQLKIEINTREHFQVDPIQKINFSIDSDYFSGNAKIITYGLDELMGTKLRALYQRRKGRDLFDAWYVFSKGLVNIENVVRIFHEYNKYNGQKITRKNFLQNMEEKQHNVDFRQDISALLPQDTDYDFDTAFDFVIHEILPFV